MTLGRPICTGVLLGLLTLAVVSPCRAQRPHEQPPYGQRTDAFRRLLFELRFQPLRHFQELRDKPSESLLLVLGNPSCLAKGNFPEGLRAFVEQGGAVLIATDLITDREAGKNLNDLAGVTVTGEKFVCRTENPNELYGPDSSAYCPFLQPVKPLMSLKGATNALSLLANVLGTGSRPALFRNPHPEQPDLRVATNLPSRLKIEDWWLPPGISRLAELPGICREVDTPFRGSGLVRQLYRSRLSWGEYENPLFAVGGTVGEGRVLVLADHSIFINRMILPRDNGNLEFAANCLHWLRGGVSTPMEALRAAKSPEAAKQLAGQRDKVLFWDDGTIRTNFEVPLKMKPLKPSFASEPAIVAAIDKTLARLEDTDFYNRQILDSIDDLPDGRRRVLRYAAYLLTLAAFLLLAYRFLWRSRYRPEAAVPLLGETVSQQEPKLSLLDQRRRALLHSGNVWEIVHNLAREYFESAGVPLTGAAPRVELKDGSRRQRWRINRRLARLWKLARGDAPIRISPTAMQRWLRELEEVKTALRNETIQLMI